MKTTNRNSFDQDVLSVKKLVLLDVWAPFCGPCRGLEPVVEALSEEVKDWADVVKLDASEDMDFAQDLGVSGLPTFFVFKDGQAVDSIAGATTKDKIMQMLSQYR